VTARKRISRCRAARADRASRARRVATSLTVADGAYNAAARHADYASETRRFELGGKPATIDFTLTAGGAIRGQVVTRDGTPLPGALVQATHGRGRGA